MTRSPDGRQVCILRGEHRREAEDAKLIIDAIADSDAPIFNTADGLLWIVDGKCVPLGGVGLRQFVARHLCSMELRNTGTAEEPFWEAAYPPFVLPDHLLRLVLHGRPREEGGGGALEERFPKLRKSG